MFVGTFVAIVVGIVTGLLSAWRRSGIVDKVSTNSAIVFYALPTQFIGMVLILIFGKYLPTSQMRNEVENFFSDQSTWSSLTDIARHMVLPALCLALTLFGEYTLVVRSSMLETLGEDYVLTARAKGLPPAAHRRRARVAQRDAADRDARGAVARVHRRRARSWWRSCSRGRGSAVPCTRPSSIATTRCCRVPS